jgi:hypothetical protein
LHQLTNTNSADEFMFHPTWHLIAARRRVAYRRGLFGGCVERLESSIEWQAMNTVTQQPRACMDLGGFQFLTRSGCGVYCLFQPFFLLDLSVAELDCMRAPLPDRFRFLLRFGQLRSVLAERSCSIMQPWSVRAVRVPPSLSRSSPSNPKT